MKNKRLKNIKLKNFKEMKDCVTYINENFINIISDSTILTIIIYCNK